MAGASVRIEVAADAGGSSRGSPTGIDGRFALRLASLDTLGGNANVQRTLREVTLRAGHPHAIEDRTVTRTAEQIAPTNDIGSITLRRASTFHVLVTDANGEPVERALVESRRVQRTCANGRAVVIGDPAEIITRRIGAPGARVDRYVAVGGSGSEEDPLRFVVEPANRLEVRVSSAGVPTTTLVLEVRSPTRIFTNPSGEHWPSFDFHLAAGAAESTLVHCTTGPPASWRYRFPVGADGIVRLVSLRPAVPVELRLLDPLDQVAAIERTATPGAGVHDLIALHAARPAARLHGTVRLEGRPIERARVTVARVTDTGRRSPAAWTATDGSFEIVVLATGETVPLEATRTGAGSVREEVLLVAGEQEVDVDLPCGHGLAIRVHGPDRTPVPAEIELLDLATGTAVAPLGPGDEGFRIAMGFAGYAHLPPGTYRARAEVAGRTFERDVHVPTDDDFVLQVPEPLHRVRIEVPAIGFGVLELRISDADGTTIRRRMRRDSIKDDWSRRRLWLFGGTYHVQATRDGEPIGVGTWTIPSPDGRVEVPIVR